MKEVWTHYTVSIAAYEGAQALSNQPAAPQDGKTLTLLVNFNYLTLKTSPQEDIPVEILMVAITIGK
jgi:hypothetical protein